MPKTTKTAEQAKIDEKNDKAVMKTLSTKKGLPIAEIAEKAGLDKIVAKASLKRLGAKVRTEGQARATRYFAAETVAA